MSYKNQKVILSTAMDMGITPDVADSLDMLTPDHFTDAAMRGIFLTIEKMRRNQLPVDFYSVAEQLKDPSLSDALTVLIRDREVSTQVIGHAKQLINDNRGAVAAKLLHTLADELTQNPAAREGVLARLETITEKLASSDFYKEPVQLKDMLNDYISVMEDRCNGNIDSIGLDIGLDCLINRNDLIIVGGSPGMGKTALAMYVADYIGRNGHKTLMFSLEMDDMQVLEREVCRHGRFESYALKDPVKYDLNYDALTAATSTLQDMPIFIDDTPQLDLPTFRRKCRKFKERHPDLSLIILDYITLMELPNADAMRLQIKAVSRGCKLLAKELKTPIMLLSQCNREANKQKREFEISDLYESGALEQDGDKIFFPYREEMHHSDSHNKGLAKIQKKKVRDGKVGDVLLSFEKGNFYPTDREWKEREDEPKGSKRYQNGFE